MWPFTQNTVRSTTLRHLIGAACLVLLVVLTAVSNAQTKSFTISLSLRYPAGDQSGPQPTGLYVDSRTGEIYVADASTARIAIYDAQRRFNFEFSTRSRLANPRQVAVDSQGRIFVLGDLREHTLAVFDYNGDFLGYIDPAVDNTKIEPTCFTITAEDQLLLLAAMPARVYKFKTDGEFVKQFPLMDGADEDTRMTPMLENLNVVGNRMMVTLPMFAQAAVCELNGELIRYIGVAGGGPTELSFPMAATVAPDGGYVVLDKHRHLVQFFDSNGSFVREIGNFGTKPGFFFHPTVMAVCSDGALIVGQMYANRVQAVVLESEPVAEVGR